MLASSCPSAGEGSIFARILDSSMGGAASLRGHKRDEEVYRIRKLETVYFHPQPSYIRQCLQLSDVRDYNEMANYKEPVYLITGLKIAWGTTISSERGWCFETMVEGSARAPGGPAGLQLGVRTGVSGESWAVTSFDKPADFVLGIQVQKVYHKRAFFVDQPVLAVKRVVKRAVLVDDDEVEIEDGDDEADFTVVDLGNSELEGLVPWSGHDSKGEDEIWLLPSNAV